MAPKAKQIALKTYTPSEEELKQARDILNGACNAAKRSKMASMVAFVKTLGGDDAILNSRGDERQEYLAKYVAMMEKRKATKSTIASTVSHDQRTAEVVQFHRWSRHQMEQEVGAKKAEGWISCGKLKMEPDRITGSTDPDCVEYIVPVSWTQETGESSNKQAWVGEDAATEEDLVNTKSLQLQLGSDGSAGSAGSGSAQTGSDAAGSAQACGTDPIDKKAIKVESQTPQDKMAEAVSTFLRDPLVTKLKLQAIEVECDKLLPEKARNPLMGTYFDAVDKHCEQVRKMLKGITRVVQGSQVEKSKMPQLITTLEKIYDRHTQLMDFAVLNNLSAKRRRQKTPKAPSA